jgi:hypothetical protein
VRAASAVNVEERRGTEEIGADETAVQTKSPARAGLFAFSQTDFRTYLVLMVLEELTETGNGAIGVGWGSF